MAFFIVTDACSDLPGHYIAQQKDLIVVPMLYQADQDEQLLDLLFTEFNSAQAKTWISHGKILKVIDRGNCNSKEELKHLLDAMETKNFNDLADLTMVIENMAGRSGPAKDGGSFIFFKYSGDTNRMNEIMEEKIALHRDEKDVRFKEAVRRYRSTYKKFEGSDF